MGTSATGNVASSVAVVETAANELGVPQQM